MSDLPLLSAEQLRQLVQAQAASASSCHCKLERFQAWESIADSQLPATLQAIASLADPEVSEPTFEELHPQGTRYDSPEAPIALAYFPYNRCTVYQCSHCQRIALRYTEYGGYYIDHRLRWIAMRTTII